MDSLTQFALGASVALATLGKREKKASAAWKLALVGGMVGTLPDLDAFIDFGDDISNMIRHRAETHGLLYITLITPLIALFASTLMAGKKLYWRWCLAVWLILITHVAIDFLTIYGTQLAQPFSDHPYGVGSIFVIDPLYTLPLLFGLCVGVIKSGVVGLRWNTLGLLFSTAYLAWGVAVHQHASELAMKDPPVAGEPVRIVVTAAPLNTILWRAVAITPTHYYEGWYSLFDGESRFKWKAYARDPNLIAQHQDKNDVKRMSRFTHGFFSLEESDGRLYLTDLRLGLEPFYSFRFDLGSVSDAQQQTSVRIGVRPDLKAGLPWLWARMTGDPRTLEEHLRVARR